MNLPLTALTKNLPHPASRFNPLSGGRKTTKLSAASLSLAEANLYFGEYMVLTEDGRLLQVSENLKKTLVSSFNADANGSPKGALIGQEFSLICQMLKQSRSRFPHQSWAIECKIFTQDSTSLNARARWIKASGCDQPQIFIEVEDSQQIARSMWLDEVQAWGLTPREQEVCLLHHEGHTYNQIAERLCITLNTVKKHMRSIHAKRRAVDES